MESDIGSVAAFVFAHTEAIKGMRQMITIIDDAYEGAPEDEAVQQEIQDQKDVVQKVWVPGRSLQGMCWALFRHSGKLHGRSFVHTS